MNDSTKHLMAQLTNKLKSLPPPSLHGLLLGLNDIIDVVAKHDPGRASDWLQQSAAEHIDHAHKHLMANYAHNQGPCIDPAVDECGCEHEAHAGARLVFARGVRRSWGDIY